ncbi:MAG: glycosyl hydrolase family 28-related protein [Candidatus Acidiferrum sp.]
MSRNISLWALVILMFIGIALLGQPLLAQTYSLPNDNTSCPSNCRLITWKAGSDLWNNGVLPTYAPVTCSGLAGNGTTNDGPAIQACINNASSGTAVYIPVGTYLVNSTISLKSNVVLRGAGPTTQINLGASGTLTTQNFSTSAISGYNGYGVIPSPYTLTGTPQKGDTTVTIGSGSVSVGTWIKIFGNDNPSLISATGTDGFCPWCGDNSGFYVQQQFVQVTGIVSGTGGAGSVVTISRPLYYTPYTTSVTVNGQTEPAGAKYDIITFSTQKAGYEYFHVTATGDIGATQIILLQGCLYCWVKGVETQETGSNSGSAHVEMDYCYGNEIRDGYYHDQRSGASGSGYGVYFQFTNGDAKIENNIMRHNRHGFVFQGGGSGVAMLYNYIDDLYTDDTTYLGSARTSHGAHPFMNLFEGNVASHITADDFSGTTSHDVFFRNWLWGDETGNWSGAVAPTGTPGSGFDAIDLYQGQQYYSYVGNVLGRTGLHTTWSLATLSITCTTNNCGYEAPSAPGVYSYGSSTLGSAATSSSTILRHGNWDYKTNGVAYWDGGSNHTLATSMYYSSQPSYLSGYAWPLEGPEGNPTINANAAENCYLKGPSTGGSFNPATCYTPGSSQAPAAPTKLTTTVTVN